LDELGLESSDLVSADREDGSVAFQYHFDGDKAFRPKLSLTFDGDTAVDASLSPGTKEYLKALVSNRRRASGQSSSLISEDEGGNDLSSIAETEHVPRTAPVPIKRVGTEDGENRPLSAVISEDGANSTNESSVHRESLIRRVNVPLTFDAEFFNLLQGDVVVLDELQVKEQKALLDEISELSNSLTRLTAPSRFTKTDSKSFSDHRIERLRIHDEAQGVVASLI
jgi:E3 ubiquitin-protein ligase BAH